MSSLNSANSSAVKTRISHKSHWITSCYHGEYMEQLFLQPVSQCVAAMTVPCTHPCNLAATKVVATIAQYIQCHNNTDATVFTMTALSIHHLRTSWSCLIWVETHTHRDESVKLNYTTMFHSPITDSSPLEVLKSNARHRHAILRVNKLQGTSYEMQHGTQKVTIKK